MKTVVFFLICFLSAVRAESDRLMVLRHTEGERSTEYHYTTRGAVTRLERQGQQTPPPPPWNLIDHATGDITVVRPHNQTISTIPASAFSPGPGPSAANALANLPDLSELPPEVAQAVNSARQLLTNPAPVVPPSVPAATPGRIGPDPSLLPAGSEIPQFPTPPPPPATPPVSGLPSLPAVPGAPPAGIPGPRPSTPLPGGMPGGLPGGMPPMIPPVAMPVPPGEKSINLQLTAHPETRTLHGFECTRHTLRLDSSLELELWLTASSDLPPFHLLTRNEPPRFGPRDPFFQWPHRVREAGKFPMLTILREAPGEPLPQAPALPTPPEISSGRDAKEAAKDQTPPPRELARWEIVQITTTTTPEDFYQPPATYRRAALLKH